LLRDYDVAIIGTGAVGCATAYTLAGYELSVCVIEKEADGASSTSGRNSAVSHVGFNNKCDSLMAHYCVRGNKGFETVCRKLNVSFIKTGAIIVACIS